MSRSTNGNTRNKDKNGRTDAICARSSLSVDSFRLLIDAACLLGATASSLFGNIEEELENARNLTISGIFYVKERVKVHQNIERTPKSTPWEGDKPESVTAHAYSFLQVFSPKDRQPSPNTISSLLSRMPKVFSPKGYSLTVKRLPDSVSKIAAKRSPFSG